MSKALHRAAQAINEEALSRMVLDRDELPPEFRGFQIARDGVLDNETMVDQGLPGSTTEEMRATGRINGYIREFVSNLQPEALQPGSNIIVATVVHLFHDGQEVSRWMNDKFVGEFQRSVGQELGHGQQIVSADRLEFEGFSDEAVGLHTLQTRYAGPISSTIVDFRMERLLGVVYLVSLGDVGPEYIVRQMGIDLERKIVRVLLDAI